MDVEVLRALATKFPRKQAVLIAQLAEMLRSDGGQSNKEAAALAEDEDGMEGLDAELLALRWHDQQVAEVRRMLGSSMSMTISIVQRPEVSDHEFREKQEWQLNALCIRTMALPIGRGMFTMFASTPVLTEPFPVPKLNLSGKAPPRGTTVELANIEVPTNMDNWPHFHNGVAAGLKVCTTFISLSYVFFYYTVSDYKSYGRLQNHMFYLAPVYLIDLMYKKW